MDDQLSERLALLRADFHRIAGRRFAHFFCPILHRDEATELCKGHGMNQAFEEASRAWIVQRADVDGFFGSMFEADYVLLQEKDRVELPEILTNPSLSRKLRPEITLDGKTIQHYRPIDEVPEHHTKLVLEREGLPPIPLALKLEPSELVAALGGSWKLGFERDLRLPALVSLLKSAHLTMFHMLGYSWARIGSWAVHRI